MSTVSGLDIANKVEREWRDRLEAAVKAERENVSEELIRLRGEAGVLIGLLQAALQIIETVDGEDDGECNQLMELQNKIVYAIRARSQS